MRKNFAKKMLQSFSILFLGASAAAAAAAASTAPPCFTTINDVAALYSDAQVVECPCVATIYAASEPSPFKVSFRAYPRDAAFIVEATIPDDPGNTFEDNIFFTSGFVFGYFDGDYNADKKNLSSALTAPFVLRPVSDERGGDPTWVGAMTLAPSQFPADKSPPASTLDSIVVRPFGDLVMASVPAVLPASPTEDDFRNAYQQLEEAVGLVNLPGRWVINVSSPLTPSFNFYFTQAYNGSSWLIEAAAEVYFEPQETMSG
jgi:hypothetical protein